MKRNFTDALLLIVIALMLFTLHCRGALAYNAPGSDNLQMPSYSQVDATTNNITIAYWWLKFVTAGPQAQTLFDKGTHTGLFQIKSSSNVERQMDWASTDWFTGLGAQLWRTFAQYDATNDWVLHVWTFTYTDTNSMRLYTNGVNMPGRWIQSPTALPGTNATNPFGIGNRPGEGSGLKGHVNEYYIWNTILNGQQINMLLNSRIKGIGKQIEPSLLRLYLPLDTTPWMLRSHNGDGGSGGKYNSFPERAYGFVTATELHPGGSSPGFISVGEPIHSYPPNE